MMRTRILILLVLLIAKVGAAHSFVPVPAGLPVPDGGDVALRMIRAYGGTNEVLPPVVILNAEKAGDIGSSSITVEFDISSAAIPNVYARIIHCSADWTPDEDGFLSDVNNRTTLIDWKIAPERSNYSRYRGQFTLPNQQTRIRFSGNWVVRIHDIDTDSLLGETRFFAVDTRATMRLNFMTDFYEPRYRVSGTAYTIETLVQDLTARLLTTNLHTVVLYRNHRWFDPFIASERIRPLRNPGSISADVLGMVQGGKIFRVSRIPAQNEYRVLDLTNPGRFPSTGQPIPIGLSDIRRNGMFMERADDGAMISRSVSDVNDEFIPIEFLLDPTPGGASDDDIFVSGSFNNWKPDRNWLMYFDSANRLYRLRQWVRRGRHNYLYANGRIGADSDAAQEISYEEFEGNTAAANNTFIAFAYYRELDYGGYDGIVAVGAGTMFGNK